MEEEKTIFFCIPELPSLPKARSRVQLLVFKSEIKHLPKRLMVATDSPLGLKSSPKI